MQAPSRFSKASGGVISLFHDEQASLCVPLAASSHNADVPVCISSVHEPSRTAASSCAACVAIFADYIEQRAHFKSDWHRYAYLRRVAAIHSSISSIRLPNLKNAFPFIYIQQTLIFPSKAQFAKANQGTRTAFRRSI